MLEWLKGIQITGKRMIHVWRKVSHLPGGPAAYSKLVGKLIPYTGSIPFRVVELTEGRARVQMDDTRRVRNHLNSIHAIALANLGEFTSGLVLNAMLPPKARAILTKLEQSYLIKARGELTATCEFALPELGPHQELVVFASIFNKKGECVSKTRAVWIVDAL
jgi:acyl-coenzyme A thioesterase PaaI-like protein